MNAKSMIATLMVAGTVLVGCERSPNAVTKTVADIVNHTGTVKQIGTAGYAIVDHDPSAEHFAPSNLPNEFKTDGARVLFSGRRGPIPPNVRMWGTPLELTSIQHDVR